RSLRVPAQHPSRTPDVDGKVVVGEVNHPGLDERLLARHMVLEPRSGLGERLWNRPRLPVLAVDEAGEGTLKLVVAQRFRLADQEAPARAGPAPELRHPAQGLAPAA